MDAGSYEQFSLTAEQLGDDRLYLKEGISLQVRKYNDVPISMQLPPFAASGGLTKPAELETGLKVHVPLFIKERRGHRAASDDTLPAWAAAEACPHAFRVLDLGSGKGTVAIPTRQEPAPVPLPDDRPATPDTHSPCCSRASARRRPPLRGWRCSRGRQPGSTE